MVTRRWIVLLFSAVLVGLAVVSGALLWMKGANPPVQAGKLETPVTVLQGLPTPALLPGSTLLPQPSAYPPVTWQPAPDCAGSPAVNPGLAASAVSDSDVRRAQLLSPGLATLKPDDFKALLASQNAEATAYTRRALINLAVNIATGRVNRASAVSYPGLPEVKTAGDLLDRLETGASQGSAAPEVLKAALQLQAGEGVTHAVCAHLLTTQAGGQTADIQWSAKTVQAQAAPTALSGAQPAGLDTVSVSPDGRWAAFTSTGGDSSGPVYLLELASGAWTNLIERINAAAATGQAQMPLTGNWDVIGWMPDSHRLMIGASDASVVLVADVRSGQINAIPFEGGGVGGEMAVGLAPDGSQFAFVGISPAGDGQVLSLYHLDTGKVAALLSLPYAQGALYFPRFSPDGKTIAYIVQKGPPGQDRTEAITLLNIATGSATVLVEGKLGLSLPTWSPDGRYLAFTRRDEGAPDPSTSAQAQHQPQQNVWVIDLATSQAHQITFITGQALRPKWAPDAKTLSFVTQDGQVGLVSLSAPGQIWRAPANGAPAASAPTAGAGPLFSSADFIP